MGREFHVRFREGLGVQFPRATRLLLGFLGPKDEAREIRGRLEEFLRDHLKLTLSPEKTLITHASDEKARFLGHEVTVSRCGSLVSESGRRDTNSNVALLMPREVIGKYLDRYSRGGRVVHKAELLCETEYTIVSRYQSVLRGLYNFYCMATNVSRRMARLKWILEVSLTKTLARKARCSVPKIYRRHRTEVCGLAALQVVHQRPGKDPLIATFGGIPFKRKPEGMGVVDFRPEKAWFRYSNARSEVVQRLAVGKCELCGAEDRPVQVHHVRKLADIDRPGRPPRENWEKIMSARKRKTLVVCVPCHQQITYGRYDGPALGQGSLESRMR